MCERREGMSSIHINYIRWSKSDSIESGWIARSSVKIYKFSTTVESYDRKVFYRRTDGPCSCQ